MRKPVHRRLAAALSFLILASVYNCPVPQAAASAAAPVIVQAAPGNVQPDSTVQLIGDGLEDVVVGIRRLEDGDPGAHTAEQLASPKTEQHLSAGPEMLITPLFTDANAASAVVPASLDFGQYALYAQKADGAASEPVFVNKTDVFYVYPNVLNLAKSREATVIGANLTRNNGSLAGDSRVVLRNKATSAIAEASVTSASPYEVVFQVPATAEAGQFDEVWVHNRHGGEYGWSKAEISLVNMPGPAAVFDVTAYGAVADDEEDDTQAIQAAIDAAAAAGGGTVLLSAGVFHLDKEQAPPAAGLVKLVPASTFGGAPSYGTDREYFRAFDSNSTTFYDYNGTGSGHVGIDLGEGGAQPVTAIRYFPRPATNATIDADMIGGKFQGSNDGVAYTDLYTIPAKPSFNGNVAAVSNPAAFRYLRYVPAEGKKGYIAELEFFTGTASGVLTAGAKPEAGLQKLTIKAGVTLKGEGPETTVLKYLDTGPIGGRDSGEGPEMITIAGSDSGIEGIRIVGSASVDRGIVLKEALHDVTIRNIELRTWYPGPAKKGMFGGIWGDGGNAGFSRIAVLDSTIESGGTITLNKMSNSRISGNTFLGKSWTPANFGNSYQNLFTDNRIDGRDDNGKRGGSRGFNFNLHPRWGGFKPTAMNYIARNDTQYIGNETSPTNDGEILLFDALVDVDADFTGDGNKILHYGNVYAAGASSASIKGMKWDANVLKDEYVLIVEGKGLGQYRRITGNTSDAIAVDRDWTIVPDATSRVSVSRFFYKNIVTDNTASNNKGNDMRMYGQALGNIFDNNRSELGSGGSPTAGNGGTVINSFDRNLTTFHPSYYNVIKHSTGSRAYIAFGGGLRIDSPRSVAAMGNVIADNSVRSLYMESGGYNFFPAPKGNIRYNVFEHNTAETQLKLDSPVAAHTVLRENQVPGDTGEKRYYDFGTGTIIIENGNRLAVQRPTPPAPPEIPGDGPMPNPPGNKMVLQAGVNGYNGAADASLMSHWQGVGNNNGAYGEFEMARYNGTGTDDKYALIRFDLSGIPADRTITGAFIELYHTQTRASSENFKTVDVHRVTSPWEEGNGYGGGTSIDGNPVGTVVDGELITGVSLNTKPSWETGPETALDHVVTSYVPGRWYHFDVTAAARDWIAQPELNFGVVLLEDVPSTANGTRTFASSQYSSVTLRPKITVFYSGDPIALPPDSIPPGDVSDPAVSNGDRGAVLTWKDAGDSDIMKVRIYNGEQVVAEAERGVQKAEVTGLANGQPVALRLVNVDGSGNESPGVTVQVWPRADRSVFWKGINLNGEAVTIGGRSWLSYNAARGEGFAAATGAGAAPTTGKTASFPLPFLDDYDLTHMMNTNLSASKQSLKLEQTASNGFYRVYLWFMEPSADRSRSFHIDVEGGRAATMAGSELRNHTVRYGPYDAVVQDGKLTVELLNVKGDPLLQGMEIYKDYYPAVTLKDLRAGGTTVTGFVYEAGDYTVMLPYGTTAAPEVTAEAFDPVSAVTVTQAVYAPGTAIISVVSGDLTQSAEYRIAFRWEAPSSDASLASVSFAGQTVPGSAFKLHANRKWYELEAVLPKAKEGPVITAVPSRAGASAVIEQPKGVPGKAVIKVTAEDGTTTREYRLSFKQTKH
ncbi:TGF-beta propeptide [Paenibacillus sp. UNCCL117]|uniref:DNRLRE domain-containing protein n=1 Tax=unclassified Paenibacillus TaxID=185978 RepID=UPI00088FA31A|nr:MULTISPECIES: DNRLRE domain-containing protein [unclassified Paenibacillus]SDC93108.1 TGF-beta propeptide [Paenibacillus sp. cl123]SFW29482.1 TGF-beta propeptide [Paenibacillus sp. UNCCL117]